MSMLQSTLDLFPSYGQVYFGTIASYGAFSLYGRNDIKNENRLRDMIHKDAIFDDDFDKNEVARLNDNAKMIYGVMLDYAKAFPNSADNLSIVFIDPSELQPIVLQYISILMLEERIILLLKLISRCVFLSNQRIKVEEIILHIGWMNFFHRMRM